MSLYLLLLVAARQKRDYTAKVEFSLMSASEGPNICSFKQMLIDNMHIIFCILMQ